MLDPATFAKWHWPGDEQAWQSDPEAAIVLHKDFIGFAF